MSHVAQPIDALSGPAATATANTLAFIAASIALCKWVDNDWSAAGRLTAIKGNLQEVEELYRRLEKQAQALILTAQEQADVRIRGTTLGLYV